MNVQQRCFRAALGVLAALLVSGSGASADDCVVKDFAIHLTPNEPFFWNTSKPYSRRDAQGVITQIQSFDEYHGFCAVYAIASSVRPLPVTFDYLRGNAVLMDGEQAAQYNAIPHQTMEYESDAPRMRAGGVIVCPAPFAIAVEGFAGNLKPGLGGTLAICSFGSFIPTTRFPEFDVNVSVWNQNEVPQSRHLHVDCFGWFDLVNDLQLDRTQIFTAKWQAVANATVPLWAVFLQSLGDQQWAGNVWTAPGNPPEVCWQHEPGSLLVFPMVDNRGDRQTILEIANTGELDIWLAGYMVVRAP
jgi:hypothetical protein